MMNPVRDNALRYVLPLAIVLGALSLLVMTAFAQDETSPPEEIDHGTAEVIGDADSRALSVVQFYIETRDPELLAENAAYFDQTDTPITGRDQIAHEQHLLFGDAFTNTRFEPVRYIVAEDHVVAEFYFSGVNTGPYRDMPPTELETRLMMVGIFQVEDDLIVSMGLYYDEADLWRQLGYEGTGVGFAPAADPGVRAADTNGTHAFRDVIEQPDAYYGETVTVDGVVGEILSDSLFVLEEDGILGTDRILVMDATGDQLELIRIEGARVRLTGTLQPYADMEMEFTEGVDGERLEQHRDLPVLMADDAVNLDDVESLGAISDDPEAFFGQRVQLEGLASETIGERAFILREDAFLGGLFGADEILVIDATQDGLDFIPLEDTSVLVTGVVQQYMPESLEAEYGLIADDERYADYEGSAVIVAESVINLDDVDTIGNLTDEPEVFYGQVVSIEGIVSDDYGPNAFAIREDVFLGEIFGASRVLVILQQADGANAVAMSFDELDGERVRVTGEVQPFTRADMVAAHNLEDRDDLEDFEGEPVILAEEVVITD